MCESSPHGCKIISTESPTCSMLLSEMSCLFTSPCTNVSTASPRCSTCSKVSSTKQSVLHDGDDDHIRQEKVAEILTGLQTIIQDQNIMGIFGRSYLLNKGLIMMSYCHADVLAHKSTLKRLEQLNETIGSKYLKSEIWIRRNLIIDQTLTIGKTTLWIFSVT